jgi:hypothetical protein
MRRINSLLGAAFHGWAACPVSAPMRQSLIIRGAPCQESGSRRDPAGASDRQASGPPVRYRSYQRESPSTSGSVRTPPKTTTVAKGAKRLAGDTARAATDKIINDAMNKRLKWDETIERWLG